MSGKARQYFGGKREVRIKGFRVAQGLLSILGQTPTNSGMPRSNCQPDRGLSRLAADDALIQTAGSVRLDQLDAVPDGN